MGCRWRGSNGDSDWLGKLFCFLGCTEQSIYGWGRVEMGDIFGLEELPD